MYRKCLNCAGSIKKNIGEFKPEIAVVLGSGLGFFSDSIDVKFSLNYSDIPGFPISTVKGHSGKFLFGYYGGRAVAVAKGRVHCYEGYSAAEAVMPIRVLRLLGAETVILTNAAGGINDSFNPGDIMLIRDHISLFIDSPLIGANIDELGARFPDMSGVYEPRLKKCASSVAKSLEITLKEGVYAQLKGPQYETPAEIKALEVLGADAVGMSTAVEAIAAVHAGMKVCGISVITNMAAGKTKSPLSHKEVIENSKKAEKNFCRLLDGIVKSI